MTKAQIKNLLLYLIIVVIILLISLFFWYFFKTTKQEVRERTLEDILREDLTAPAGEIPQVSPETLNNLSALQDSQETKAEEELIQALTPPQ